MKNSIFKFLSILVLLLLLIDVERVSAQVPTAQDCMGAIPVCQTTYYQQNSYSGTGNYPNEINPNGGTCMLAGEKNDVWYIFTVISSGQLGFAIIPNNSADDYDWALYNLTNANCSDIYNNYSLEVCCNWSASDGATGMNNPANASCHAGASDNLWSPTINVTTGQTYVLNISNYSSTQYGYTLDFSHSTASIFDNVPPTFQSVNTGAITCGTNQITFNFSENVLCNTVQACDFQLTGPGGPYTITSVSGAGCAVGAPMENTFTITFTPPMTQPGTYNIALVNTCGSVTDNCNNVAPVNSFNFNNPAPVVSVSPTSTSICSGQCATLTASGATTYTWQPGNLSGASVNVCPNSTTTYTVTGVSSGCTSTASATVNVTPSPVTVATASPTSICSGQSATLTASGATTYTWQPGNLTGSTVTVSPTTTTTYTVTGANGNCTSSATVTVTVNPSPNITISPSSPQICYGQSVNLTTNSNVPLASCTWNPTTGLNPSNSCSPTASPTTTTTYFVQGQTAAGCTGTASVTIVVNPLPVISVSSDAPNNTICNGQCTQLTATSTPAATSWQWAPSTGLSSTNISNPNACPTSTTTYMVTAQTAASCTSTATITINVNPVSTLSVSPNPAEICLGGSIQLNVSGTPAITSCNWNPSSSLNPPTGSCSPTATPTTTTTYTITAQNSYSCTSSITLTVTVHPNPTITVVPPADTICFGESTQLQANDNPPGLVTSWNWSPSSGLDATDISNPTASPQTTTIYTVTGTSDAGCTGSQSVYVMVNPLPQPVFNPMPTLCVTSPPFTLNFATPPGGIYSGPGVIGDTIYPSIAGVGTHTITYTYTDPNTGCTNTATQTVTFNAGITVSVNPSNITICPESSATLTASGATNYIWTPSLGLSNNTTPVVTATPPSSITYTVTGYNPDGCSGTATASVNYYNTNLVQIFTEPEWGCNPVNISVYYAPELIVEDSTWVWNFGDHYSNNNISYEKNPSHLYQHEGNFIITLHAKDTNGCEITDYEFVEVYITPHADFYFNPPIAYNDNPLIQFTDLSLGANFWSWNFGDPASYNYNFSEEQNPFHNFTDSGTYMVQLIVTSSHTCSDTIEKPVTILPRPVIFIPNAFTPNKDLLNDVFKPSIIGFDKSTYNFYIFDRWGREQFYTNDINVGWDGKHKGKECAEGVYVYLITFSSYTGQEYKYKGIVTLYR